MFPSHKFILKIKVSGFPEVKLGPHPLWSLSVKIFSTDYTT